MTAMVTKRKASLFTSILAKVVLSGTGLILIPIYAKYLTKQEYGYWLMILSIVNYLALANFGIAQTVANYVAGNWAKENSENRISSYVSTAWYLYLTIIIILCVFLTFGMLFKFGFDWPKDYTVFWITACGALMAMPWQLFAVSLRSIEKIYEEQLFIISATIIRAVAIFSLLVSGHKLLLLALVNTFSLLLPRLLAKLYLKKVWPSFMVSSSFFDKRLVKHLMKPSISFLTIQVAALLVFSTDNIVIGFILGSESVPEYAVLGQLLIIAISLLTMLSGIYYPAISRHYKQGNISGLHSFFQSVGLIQLYIGSVMLVGFWLLGEEIIGSWVGDEFYPGDIVFVLMLCLLSIQIIITPADAVIMATSSHERFSYVALAEGLINIILSLWWVSIFGIAGVVLATILGRIISGVYMYATISSILNWSYRKHILLILRGLILPLGSTLMIIELAQYYIWGNNKTQLDVLLASTWLIFVLFMFARKNLSNIIIHLKSL